jgi:hypothetical protein
MNDVSRKFQQDPDDVPDLSKDEFLGRKKVMQQVGKWCQDMKGKGGREEWTPILYRYEVRLFVHEFERTQLWLCYLDRKDVREASGNIKPHL